MINSLAVLGSLSHCLKPTAIVHREKIKMAATGFQNGQRGKKRGFNIGN